MRNKFVEKCEQVKEGKLSLEELVSESLTGTYVSINIKELVAKWIEDSLLYEMGIEEIDGSRTFVENLCFEERESTDTNMFMEYEVCKTLLTLNQYVSANFYPYDCYAYDLVNEIGLIGYINEITKGDYNNFTKFIDSATQISSYSAVKTTLIHFKDLPSQNTIDEFKRTLDDINPDTISGLLQIMNFNNPAEQALDKELKSTILSATNEILKESLQKEEEKKEENLTAEA